MTDKLTTYLWTFDGAPSETNAGPEWSAIPGRGMYATPHARVALDSAASPLLTIFRAYGTVLENGAFVCADAALVGSGDASAALWLFARRCALSVANLWDAPKVVRKYLETGDSVLRIAARQTAWTASCELDKEPRLAARAAMIAAEDLRPVRVAKETARLVLKIRAESSLSLAYKSYETQQRMLGSALLRAPLAIGTPPRGMTPES